jgi:hypothetical protein
LVLDRSGGEQSRGNESATAGMDASGGAIHHHTTTLLQHSAAPLFLFLLLIVIVVVIASVNISIEWHVHCKSGTKDKSS